MDLKTLINFANHFGLQNEPVTAVIWIYMDYCVIGHSFFYIYPELEKFGWF